MPTANNRGHFLGDELISGKSKRRCCVEVRAVDIAQCPPIDHYAIPPSDKRVDQDRVTRIQNPNGSGTATAILSNVDPRRGKALQLWRARSWDL
jgi:hypothetical protein